MNGPGRRIDKRRFNRAHERIRNRVENVVRYVKRHQLFAQGRAFTHSVEELATVEEDCWPRERPGAAPLPAVSLVWAVAPLVNKYKTDIPSQA